MKTIIFLLIIIFIAAFLRFFQLDTNPPSLTWDEAAWGYNAYSLSLNGRDEFNRLLPYDYLESFGDFKPPVYAYLDILPIKILGLTELAVRIPSALFGVLTVLTTYFLVLQIFQTSKKKYMYALVSAGILAISPWHILLSRAAFEANIATFFLVFAVYTFLAGVHDKPKFLFLSALSFVLSIYTFNTPRIVAPLLIAVLAFIFRKKLLALKRFSLTAAIIGLIIIVPSINFLLSPQARLRYQEVNIFSNINLIKTSNQEIENDHNAWWSKIIHNRRVFYAREYMKHYFDNLSLNFLFIKGDGNPKFSTQDVGQMYLWELPFLLIGGFLLFRLRENNWFIIPLWLIIGIIPAAAARETPHALRIEAALPTFQILVSYGIVNAYLIMKKYQRIFLPTLSFVIVAFFVYFIHIYFIQYPWRFSGDWQYGYKDSISYIESVQNQYDHIVVSDTLGRPYTYYLFYLKVPPEEFRKSAVVRRDSFGFVNVESFSKFSFPKVIQINQNTGKTLYITSSGEKLLSGLKPLKTFYKLDGSPILQAFTI